MGKSRADAFKKELRRRLQRGDREALHIWLEEQAADNPAAAEELARLKQGIPLRTELENAVQSEQQRRKQRERLLKLLAITTLPSDAAKLARLTRELRHLSISVAERLTEQEQQRLTELQQAVRRERARRFRRRWYPLIGLGLTVVAVSITAWQLYEFSLHQSASHFQTHHRQQMQQQQDKLEKQTETILQRLEQQPGLYLEMSGEERTNLRAHLTEVQETRLQNVQAQALAQQAEQARRDAERLQAPTPDRIVFNGDPAIDEIRLETELNRLSRRIREKKDSQMNTAEDEKQLRTLQQALESARSYRQLLETLSVAQDYGVYLSLVNSVRTEGYPPAAQALAFRDNLPPSEKMAELVRPARHRMTKEEEKALTATLVDGAPTFSPAFPAVPEQLQLLTDLTTNRALQQKLYRVLTAQGECFISEEAPSTANGELHFCRSPLDPQLHVDDNPDIRRDRVEAARMVLCNPAPVPEAAGLTQDNAATDLNVLKALGAVLNTEAAQCPPTARAYLYDRLLRVAQAPKRAIATGMALSPRLQKDAESFAALLKELAFTPDGNCWLRQTDARIDKRLADWFRDHAGADYAKEAADNFSELRKLRPAYCGYIDASGNPVLLRPLQKKRAVWYMRDGAMHRGESGAIPQAATPLSPLFITTKL